MKQLFHLKSRNLNETNLTSSKAKTVNEHISVRVSVQNSPPMVLIDHDHESAHKQETQENRNKIMIRYAHSISISQRH